MEAIKIITILLAVSLLVWNCNNQTSTKNNANHDTHEYHHSESDILRLNTGEKWLVNEEMKPFIIEAEEILVEFMATESNDYITLAAQLKEKNSGLINSCTMKGESHDELHKWLHPHIDLIQELGQEGNFDKAKALVQELNNSFKTYHQYFQ